MGVTGLWRLIEPAGKPVPVETLENKVLAVDISIWLHQMVKGYQDAKGAPIPNAHLMGLFQRLCKLLYFRIKPVFVFDGAFPELKKETIAKRQDSKAKYNSESERIKRELALLLSKKTAVSSILGKEITPPKSGQTSIDKDDIFKLPALPQKEDESESESEDEQNSSGSSIDVHSIDIQSETFKNLGVKEKYDVLIELKETRKMNSWGRLHELPKESNTFSDFQMQRLLKRRKVQECLEETEKEMGDTGMSLNDLESLLNEEGIDTKIDTLPTKRIASNVSTRFLLIRDVKKALAEAKQRNQAQNNPTTSKIEEISEKDDNIKATTSKDTEITEIKEESPKKLDELEDDLQKAIQMSLECVDEPKQDTSVVSKTDDSWTSCMTDTDYSDTDSEEGDGFEQPDMTCAKAYIMQYSDFTHQAIDKIVTDRHKGKSKKKIPKVDEILNEINKEKSIIVDNVQLSSGDEDDESPVIISSSEENNKITAIEENTSSSDDQDTDKYLDSTQASVICVENPVQEVIDLDSSIEEVENIKTVLPSENVTQESNSSDEIEEVANSDNKSENESSDSDFEEVPEENTEVKKPVVELTLNMGNAPDDDIFADIFEKPEHPKEDKNKAINETKVDNEVLTPKSILVDNVFKVPEVPVLKTSSKIIPLTNLNPDSESEKNPEKPSETNVDNAANTVIQDNVEPAKSSESADVIVEPEKQNHLIKTPNPPKQTLTTEQLTSMVEDIQNEEQDLMQEKGRLDRIGRNITEQMTKEAQELLQIFGIPYIVAPMEAEAQCAFLESVNLTDGTITDDSDIWLFGGRTVYKNFFNQKKHVLQFLAERIEKSFNLNREQLILLALLVGSDYTTGLSGVGPVTAMEILASFPFNKRQLLSEESKQARYAQMVKGLQEFKQWVRAGKRTDNTSLKKKLKNVALTEEFPSVRVVQAYLEPNIEKSEDKFTWGELDITILRDYTKAKFGWSQNKLDEIIKPVLKRMQDRKTQRSVQDFFKRKVEFQSLEEQMSKRVKAAVQKMGPEGPLALEIENADASNKPAAPKRKSTKKDTTNSKNKAGPSAAKQRKNCEEAAVLLNQGVKVVTQIKDGKSELEIKIPKTDRFQELIPQREQDKRSLLENKMKAIELFRKTKLDQKRKQFKRKALQPKEKAELSESDSD
ncbi:DNA repair protein complementing XP-G cells homolog [Spodoptera litura]|uniref:DNA repair protein complementing XP-G cells homolog n=1 Tax=Spodoptera litura TaxID=69820 RepID=A0A9J7IN23_SPOLT|nr:DNA repair protein complementing XP-G cells homolog [Spodoptera litura]